MSAASGTEARIAVIGAGGFVGSRLSERLLGDGFSVLRFTREQPAVDAEGTLHPGLRAAGLVFHLASSLTPAVAERRPDLVAADHQAFVRLLDGLAACRRPPLLVLAGSASTVCESGPSAPLTEEAPTLPHSAYAKAKLALEQELHARGPELPYVITRFTNLYGPGHPLRPGHGVIMHWFDAVAQGRPLRLYGPPEAERDYVFVDDAIDALLRFVPEAASKLPHRLFHIGSGQATSLDALLAAVLKVTGADLPVERYPGRDVDFSTVLLDVRRARSVLGWRAHTPLESGLASTWQWFRTTAAR
ncbi:NAD-dependent epimerase/dehydratase family protein [Streptomyces platensis]|uniref:NAD-dependent epimerase/dehydratase family protein n=1 Tax=Streptomyces platensis TaxID=58346 RepID=UPI0036B622F1